MTVDITPEDIALKVRLDQKYGYKPNIDATARTRAEQLEAQGVEVWLKTLAPDSFNQPFSTEQLQFWEHFWALLHKRKRGEELTPDERNIIFPIHRAGGKSTVAEMAAIAEGCILGKGFVLYLSDSQLLAEEHLYSVKAILENGHFAEYYPAMSKPKTSASTHTQQKFTQDTIITENGWGMTARGITGNVRGGRLGTLRFTLIINDDIDSLNDSLAVIEKKKRIIARSVFPAMDKKLGVTIFAQNLISENSVVSQIVHRKTDILSERTIIGDAKGVKAFKELELDVVQRPDGSSVWQINNAVPSWPYFNINDAKSFLALSGKEAFLAEYQHEFDERSGRVISNYNEEAQIITWSEFERVTGSKCIPSHWNAVCGLDVGYSDGMHPHYSAWVFIAVGAMNSPLANKHFIYRARTFRNTSIDDQAIEIWKDILPSKDKPVAEYAVDTSTFPPLREKFGLIGGETGGQVKHWQISHEKTGEMLTLRQRYGLPFVKQQNFKATDGIAQWNTMSLPDFSQPNPFKDDEQCEDGQWLIGCPQLFYIVDDAQYEVPVDDKGLKVAREQIQGWEWVKTKITETGLTEERPSKINDDVCDVIKTLLHYLQAAYATELTPLEKIVSVMPEVYKEKEIEGQTAVNKFLWMQKKMKEEMNKPQSMNPIDELRRLRG